MKNILVVDDSALMRRVLCDIIDGDERFHVQDRASNGLEALVSKQPGLHNASQRIQQLFFKIGSPAVHRSSRLMYEVQRTEFQSISKSKAKFNQQKSRFYNRRNRTGGRR